MCEFSCRSKMFRVATVYAHNRNPERNEFFDLVSSKMNVSVPTILCGDFNCVLDRSVDRRGSAHDDYSRESVRALTSLFDAAAVTDIWRYLHPVSSSFTWSRWDGTATLRMDLMGCPYAWLTNVSSSEIIPCPFSDHCAISMGFSIVETAPLGQGVWKLNTSILDDDEYTELINSFWGRWRQAQTAYPTLAKWWDAGKSRIKGITIAYCAQKTKKESATRDLLTRLACHLKSRVDAGFVDCMAPYRSTLAQLERLDVAAARGAQVRSPSRWIEEGESSSAFYLRQERKCGVDRRISALRQANGSIVSSPSFSPFTLLYFLLSPLTPLLKIHFLSPWSRRYQKTRPRSVRATCQWMSALLP